MAESIAVHFVEANWNTLRQFLDEVACKVETDRWSYPNCEKPLVWAYEYDLILNECEDGDLDQLFKYLKDFPKSSVCIELRRSFGNDSVDSAVKLTISLLQKFAGVVDDTFSEIWTLEEIENRTRKKNSAFLDAYRVS